MFLVITFQDVYNVDIYVFVFCCFQKELERARQEQEYATTEKQDLERRLQQQHSSDSELRTSYSDLEVSQLKAEIEVPYC